MEHMTSGELQKLFMAHEQKSTALVQKRTKAMKNNTLCMTEHEEHKKLIKHCKRMQALYPDLALLHAIPNGGQRHLLVATKLKAEGVKGGVPDLDLPIARGGYHGLRIEMKRRYGGSLSDRQKWWINELTKQGYYCAVCKGWEEAWKIIEWYVTLGKYRCP